MKLCPKASSMAYNTTMSNFNAFSKEYLESIIDPFMPGAVDYITPILYQAYTPDIFMFLFRTTGKDDEDFYFVSVQYDFVEDMERIADIVERWTGDKPIQAIATAESDDTDHKQFVAETDDIYKAVLLMIPRPKKLGYWSDHIVVKKSDDVDVLLRGYSKAERDNVRKIQKEGTESREIAVYRVDGSMELFYSA